MNLSVNLFYKDINHDLNMNVRRIHIKIRCSYKQQCPSREEHLWLFTPIGHEDQQCSLKRA